MPTSVEAACLLDRPLDKWGEALELPPEETYRLTQVRDWVFTKKAPSFAAMTNLPQALRSRWDSVWRLRTLTAEGEAVSQEDGTRRLFYRTQDGEALSSVWLPAGVEPDARAALCLSTQVGCAWGCVFCASGRVPYERNLTPGEILEPVFRAEEQVGRAPNSILFMGMGEPLANFESLAEALKVVRSPMGLGYGSRHVTVSTCGLVPQMERLAREAPRINLAVSLHAADDETRAKILPRSSRWTIKQVLHAAWRYQEDQGEGRLTFEYILLAGINDSLRSAQRLANMLRGHKAWVNVLRYNPITDSPLKPSSEAMVSQFVHVLEERGIFVRVRKPKGRDIEAACGQIGLPSRR